MTVTIELPPEIETLLRTEARSKGKDVEAVRRSYLMEHVRTALQPRLRAENPRSNARRDR